MPTLFEILIIGAVFFWIFLRVTLALFISAYTKLRKGWTSDTKYKFISSAKFELNFVYVSLATFLGAIFIAMILK